MTSSSLGVFNQVIWPGVGDVDECWIISTYWSLVASGNILRQDLPSITKMRAAAGRPDRPGATGGNNYILMKALKKLFPQVEAKNVVVGDTEFARYLQHGYVASLSLNAAFLPPWLRNLSHWAHGKAGPHQVSIYYQGGKYYIMDPLSVEGSPLIEITLEQIRQAAGHLFGHGARTGFMGDMLFHAIMIKIKQQPPADEGFQAPPGKYLPTKDADVAAFLTKPHYLDPWGAKTFYNQRHKGSDKPLGEL